MPTEACRGDLQCILNSAKIQVSIRFTSYKSAPPCSTTNGMVPQLLQPGHWVTWLMLTPPLIPQLQSCKIYKWGRLTIRVGSQQQDYTRRKWSHVECILCLQQQGFFCRPAAALLHPCSATLTPEVRMQRASLMTFCLKKAGFCHIIVCHCSCVCVRRKTLLNGWNLDGQQMHAVHLPAPSWCGLLRDVCI